MVNPREQKLSHNYEAETEERREYLATLIKDELNINKSDTIQDFELKISQSLNPDLLNYYNGERNKKFFISDSYKRIGDKLENEFIEEQKVEEQRKFRKVINREYSVLRDKNNKEVRVFGFVKGEKTSARVEERLIKGKKTTRLRGKDGRFIAFRNKTTRLRGKDGRFIAFQNE